MPYSDNLEDGLVERIDPEHFKDLLSHSMNMICGRSLIRSRLTAVIPVCAQKSQHVESKKARLSRPRLLWLRSHLNEIQTNVGYCSRMHSNA